MTPRIPLPAFAVGDRVEDKRTGPGIKAGRGTVVGAFPDACRIRWDRSGNEGFRANQFLRLVEDTDA